MLRIFDPPSRGGWGGRQHRGILREFRVPRSELRVCLAPAEIAVAEIEIAERATDGDLADSGRLAENHAFEGVKTGMDRRPVARDVIRIALSLVLNRFVASGHR